MKDTRNAPSLRSHEDLLEIIPEFLHPEASDALLKALQTQIAWNDENVKMFGRSISTRRKIAFFGLSPVTYRYSGAHLKAESIPPCLDDILKTVRRTTGHPFNSILLHLYPDGGAAMGWHRDNEAELGPAGQIQLATLSLGACRRFAIRRISSKSTQIFPLHSGTLVQMKQGFQSEYQHCVFKDPKILAPRINLSFRNLFEPSRHE